MGLAHARSESYSHGVVQPESRIQRLRRNAERALERSAAPEAEAALEALVSHASPGSEDALFAHRHLAELRLQRNPWRAALHLRALVAAAPNDDVPHALMGLCQALLGNYRAAVAAYRRAAAITPDTPWYHHNLGHLLDVALDAPREATVHLRRAHLLEPDHDEIAGSYAHCLARCGELDQALHLAELAVELAPGREAHIKLRDWIAGGAPSSEDVAANPPESGLDAESDADDDEGSLADDPVVDALNRSDLDDERLGRALAVWDDVVAQSSPVIRKADVVVAALDYVIAFIDDETRGPGRLTKTSLAAQHGVSVGSLSRRAAQIVGALDLRPGDPRY